MYDTVLDFVAAPTGLYNFCREANQYLGVLTVAGVVWRGLPLAITRFKSDWTMKHRVIGFHLLGLYGLATAVGAIYAQSASAGAKAAGVDASVASLMVTVASVATIMLCILWPHPLRDEEQRK